MKRFLVFMVWVFCVACDRDCSSKDEFFVQNMDQYKKAGQWLERNKTVLTQTGNHNKGIEIAINRQTVDSLNVENRSGLTSLWEKGLLLSENSIEMHDNGVVYFYVKKCGKNHHYLTYDPYEKLNIGVVDDIRMYLLENNWRYMIKRDQ